MVFPWVKKMERGLVLVVDPVVHPESVGRYEDFCLDPRPPAEATFDLQKGVKTAPEEAVL
jgi:hypothetical protein